MGKRGTFIIKHTLNCFKRLPTLHPSSIKGHKFTREINISHCHHWMSSCLPKGRWQSMAVSTKGAWLGDLYFMQQCISCKPTSASKLRLFKCIYTSYFLNISVEVLNSWTSMFVYPNDTNMLELSQLLLWLSAAAYNDPGRIKQSLCSLCFHRC